MLEEKVTTNLYDVTRVLMLQGFGIYNCDRPIPFKNPIVFMGEFINSLSGKKIVSRSIQIIDPLANITATYYGKQKPRASRESLITVILTSDNSEIYVGKINTFDTKVSNSKVDLTRIPNTTTIKDLNDFINLN